MKGVKRLTAQQLNQLDGHERESYVEDELRWLAGKSGDKKDTIRADEAFASVRGPTDLFSIERLPFQRSSDLRAYDWLVMARGYGKWLFQFLFNKHTEQQQFKLIVRLFDILSLM